MPPYSQSSVVHKPSGCIVPVESQLLIEPATEFNGEGYSENPLGSDVMVKAQRRLSFECIGGSMDLPEEMCPKSDQKVSRNVLISEQTLDVEKDFMVEQNKDDKFLSYAEQDEVNLARKDAACSKLMKNEQKQQQHGEIVKPDSTNMFTESYNQLREPIVHQNEISRCHGLSSQLVHEPLPELQVSDQSHKNPTTFVKKPMRKLMLSDFKASEENPGMLRRRFHFRNDLNSSKRKPPNVTGSDLQQVPIQGKAPTKLTTDSSYSSIRSSFSSYVGRSPNVKIVKRSGIGLHLNSIVNALPTAPTKNYGETHNASTKMLKLASITPPREVQRETEILNGVVPKSVKINHGYMGSAGTISNHLSSHGVTRNSLNTGYITVSRHGKRKSRSEQHDLVDELKESGSKRKRTEEDAAGGCSRCNCKWTRCLKLYCECFASGIYCLGSCSSQGCSNKPEFKDIVRETRACILSRNPLAFSSKADVGCSDGCCCEECKHIDSSNAGSDYFQTIGSTCGEDLKAKVKKIIISQTDFSNLQYHEFVIPSLHPPQTSASFSDHLSAGSFFLRHSKQPSTGIKEDQPEILDHSTPTNAVNIRSPNKRRVSQCKPLAIHNLASGSSYILTKARKFILKSVPSLPASGNGQ